MKILFLQNMHDAIGGITNVNIALGRAFVKDGHQVSLFSLRNGNYGTVVAYPDEFHVHLLNAVDEWGCPRYSTALEYLKKGKIIKAIHQIKKRMNYDTIMKKDLINLKRAIRETNPDIIIVSHYELFYGVPEEYLHKTISHYHTNYEQLKSNKGQIAIFSEFSTRLGAFVWLSEHTCAKAIADGMINSCAIYNPLSFHADTISSLDQQRVVFIGRFSKEKRIGLMIRLFNEVLKEYDKHSWHLDIYGVNDIEEEVLMLMNKSPNVHFMGAAQEPKKILPKYAILLLASSFEGFPLVVLEANACGLPCIAFDFGETAYEVIQSNTGILIEQGDESGYKKAILELMENADKRKQLGKNAKEFAASFQIETIKEKWYDLFKELR